MTMPVASIARLLGQLDTSGGADACWPWTGYVHPIGGYGAFNIYGVGRPQPAHRLVFELLVGPIPDGFEIDHVCHTFDLTCPPGVCAHRLCCNPTHLEAVTGEENRNRMGHRITACKHGHPLIESNRYYPRKRPGTYDCLTCRRISSRATATRIRQRRKAHA